MSNTYICSKPGCTCNVPAAEPRTWEELYDLSWNDEEREGYFDRRTTKREIRSFFKRQIELARTEERVRLENTHRAIIEEIAKHLTPEQRLDIAQAIDILGVERALTRLSNPESV